MSPKFFNVEVPQGQPSVKGMLSGLRQCRVQGAGSAPFVQWPVQTIRKKQSMCRPSAKMCKRQKDKLWASRTIRRKGQIGAAQLGKGGVRQPQECKV